MKTKTIKVLFFAAFALLARADEAIYYDYTDVSGSDARGNTLLFVGGQHLGNVTSVDQMDPATRNVTYTRHIGYGIFVNGRQSSGYNVFLSETTYPDGNVDGRIRILVHKTEPAYAQSVPETFMGQPTDWGIFYESTW